MKPHVRLASALGVVILMACAQDEPTQLLPPDVRGEFVAGTIDTFPRVEYPGVGVTINDRCMVRGVKLNRKMPPMYVNNHPVGFC